MKYSLRLLARVLRMGTLISTAALTGTVLLQIFARFFLASAPSWTEEASRFFFIYAVSFAAGLAFKDRYYVHLDLFYTRLSSRWRSYFDLGIASLTMALFLVMGIFSVSFAALGMGETSPSLGLDMSFSFASMIVMALPIVLYAWLDLRKALKHLQP